MSKQSLYELWHSILEVAKYARDELTGENQKQAIIDEIRKYRTLSRSAKTEPKIVLDSLRYYNKVTSFGLSEQDIDELIRNSWTIK